MSVYESEKLAVSVVIIEVEGVPEKTEVGWSAAQKCWNPPGSVILEIPMISQISCASS